MIKINLEEIYHKPSIAKLSDLPKYLAEVERIAGEGNIVILTGSAPIWLYLKVAHFLHGKVKKLIYHSPATGDVDILIFDHDPF